MNLNDLAYEIRKLKENQGKLLNIIKAFGKPQDLLVRMAALEKLIACAPSPTFREKMIRQAEWSVPRFYSILWNIAQGDTARVPGTVNIDQDGWFFLDRIWATYRVTAGNDIGRFRGCSSGHPAIVASTANALAEPIEIFDFLWEYQEQRGGRNRQNFALPGDLLYRTDRDGYVPGGDAFGPATTVQFQVTPTRAAEQTGVLQIVLEGVQCLDTLKQ